MPIATIQVYVPFLAAGVILVILLIAVIRSFIP